MTNVIHIITGLGDGGAEAVLYRLCLETPTQTNIVISLSQAGKYSELLRLSGFEVLHLNIPRGRLTAKGIWQLYTTLHRRKPDIVQTWMYHGDLVGGLVARAAGCKNVIWNIRHSDIRLGTIGRSTRLVATICAYFSKWIPRAIVACAEQARLAHISLGYEKNMFRVIPNGYDLTKFRPDAALRSSARAELGVQESEYLIGLVGRWNPEKDHRNLLEAMSRFPSSVPITILLVGKGCVEANAELNEIITQCGLLDRVRLLGQRSDIPAVMNALDLHVLSSRGEAFPNVVAEAMACGTPCVVTDVGDAASIVGDTGWIVTPGNSDALYEAIVKALSERDDSAAWVQRQNAARARIMENFSLELMVSRYRALWAQTIAGAG